MLDRAIGLLKQNGRLIVILYETPQHAMRTFKYLVREPRLMLIEQYGDATETFGPGQRCICELVFEKKEGEKIKPRKIPISQKQRAYLEALAEEDETPFHLDY